MGLRRVRRIMVSPERGRRVGERREGGMSSTERERELIFLASFCFDFVWDY